MKNKGFTLVEMLIVIGILSIIGLVATISLTQTKKNTDADSCRRFVEEMEDAACVYVNLTYNQDKCPRPECSVKLQDIVENGLFDNEKDDCTGEDLNLNETIKVTWIDGERTCKYEKKEICEQFVNNIETVACANVSSEGNIKLKDIVSKISYTEDKCRPIDKNLQLDANIKVQYVGGVKKCTYEGDIYYAK